MKITEQYCSQQQCAADEIQLESISDPQIVDRYAACGCQKREEPRQWNFSSILFPFTGLVFAGLLFEEHEAMLGRIRREIGVAKVYETTKSYSAAAHMYGQIGGLYNDAGDYYHASQSFEKAAALMRNTEGDVDAEGHFLSLAAKAANDADMYHRAAMLFRQAAELFDGPHGDNYVISGIRMAEGDAWLKSEDSVRAMDAYEKAMSKIAVVLDFEVNVMDKGELEHVFNTYTEIANKLARQYEIAGKYKAAIMVYNRSIGISENFNFHEEEESCRKRIEEVKKREYVEDWHVKNNEVWQALSRPEQLEIIGSTVHRLFPIYDSVQNNQSDSKALERKIVTAWLQKYGSLSPTMEEKINFSKEDYLQISRDLSDISEIMMSQGSYDSAIKVQLSEIFILSRLKDPIYLHAAYERLAMMYEKNADRAHSDLSPINCVRAIVDYSRASHYFRLSGDYKAAGDLYEKRYQMLMKFVVESGGHRTRLLMILAEELEKCNSKENPENRSIVGEGLRSAIVHVTKMEYVEIVEEWLTRNVEGWWNLSIQERRLMVDHYLDALTSLSEEREFAERLFTRHHRPQYEVMEEVHGAVMKFREDVSRVAGHRTLMPKMPEAEGVKDGNRQTENKDGFLEDGREKDGKKGGKIK